MVLILPSWMRSILVVLVALLLSGIAAVALGQELASANAPAFAGGSDSEPEPGTAIALPRPVATMLEAQVELHRRGFSCGAIDGVAGPQTVAALKRFQSANNLPDTGRLDRATCERLLLTEPALQEHVFTEAECAEVRPLPPTWLGKSQETLLAHATLLELAAERYRASPRFLQRLNPQVDWTLLAAGAVIKAPAAERTVIVGAPLRVVIRLAARELEVVDSAERVMAHFPVSIARMVEKRPLGQLHVMVAIPDPNYTFDPAVFPESAEAKQLGRKLILPPGPNSPVGRAWIGLDRPGYGIHGTPDPEKVGRTESHGCFRLANWDAVALLKLVYVGMVVVVEP